VVRVKVDGPVVHALAGDVVTVEHVPQILELVENATAVLLGPGLGRDPRTLEAVLRLATAVEKPLILDGDALFACAGHLDVLWKREGPTVLTPHAGEFARLAGLTLEDVERGDNSEACADPCRSGKRRRASQGTSLTHRPS